MESLPRLFLVRPLFGAPSIAKSSRSKLPCPMFESTHGYRSCPSTAISYHPGLENLWNHFSATNPAHWPEVDPVGRGMFCMRCRVTPNWALTWKSEMALPQMPLSSEDAGFSLPFTGWPLTGKRQAAMARTVKYGSKILKLRMLAQLRNLLFTNVMRECKTLSHGTRWSETWPEPTSCKHPVSSADPIAVAAAA